MYQRHFCNLGTWAKISNAFLYIKVKVNVINIKLAEGEIGIFNTYLNLKVAGHENYTG